MPDPTKTLYIIDGHAQIFRAYYAIRGGMTSPVTGESTQAVFGFAGMLLKLFHQFHPDYVVLTMDLPGPTFRHEMYPEYKGTRESPPEDFGPQVDRVIEMTKLFGIPIVTLPGAEADDVIATCAKRVLDQEDQSVQVRIVSKDKDLEQLITPRIAMFDIHTDTTIDLAALKENKGITPQQVTEVLALMGDKVDNIPGVEGIGPKTAIKLITEFGSIEGIYKNIDKIKGKRKENLEKGRDGVALALKLVSLRDDLDIDFDLDDARVGGIDATALRRFFKEMGFRRHEADLDRLLVEPETKIDAPAQLDRDGFAASLFDVGAIDSGDAAADAARANLGGAADGAYTAITTQAQLDDLVAQLKAAPMVSVDTETIGLGHSAALCGFCFAWETGKGVYIPVRSPNPDEHLDEKTVIETLRPILESESVPKCGHNLKYDILVLRHAGVRVRGVAFDTMIASFLLGHPGHGLDSLALAQLQYETIPISSLIGPAKNAAGRKQTQRTMDTVALDEITPYAAEDSDIALRLYELFHPQLEAMGMADLAKTVEMPLVNVLADMEFTGIRVNPDELKRQQIRLNDRIVELREDIQKQCGFEFNIDSPKQLAEVLFTRLKLPVIKRSKTGPSTDVEVLEKLADLDDIDPKLAKIPSLVVEYRQFSKLVNTYLEALRGAIDEKTQRVHASFHQTGAATGRLSSSGPNLQNIPIRTDVGRQIRKAFVAAPGHALISADYSQIELRMLAHLSEDPALIEAFENDQDIHTAVAAQVFGCSPEDVTSEQRGHAKTINFGIIYGITPFGLARRIEGLSVGDAKDLIGNYRTRFAGIDAFLDKCIMEAEQHGYVTTILGRRRTIEQITSSNGQVRALGERLAINSVVQGSAADLIKLAMVNLHARIAREQSPMRILLQIHDELVCESPEDVAAEQAKMVEAEMENAMSLRVPLKVEAGIGADWFEVK